MENSKGVSHGKPLSRCDARLVVAVLTVIMVFHIGNNHITTFDDAPSVVFRDDKGVALNAGFVSLLMEPLKGVNVIVGKVERFNRLIISVDTYIVNAQAQGVGFVGLTGS